MSLFHADLMKILNYYERLIEYYNNEVINSPPGYLVSQKNHGCDQFLHVYQNNGKLIRRGINQDTAMQQALARKEFSKRALKVLEADAACLKRAVNEMHPFDPDEIVRSMRNGYAKLPEEFFFDRKQLGISLHLDNEQTARILRHREWGQLPFEQSTYHADGKKIRTSRGEQVKSKSEALILERLYSYGINVRYEQKQTINGIIIAPDFTFEGSGGNLFYWEHIGMMDNAAYAGRNYSKIKKYYSAGLLPGDNLILSFERHGIIDMEMIDAIIKFEVIPRL